MNSARAFWVVDRERGEIREEVLGPRGDGDVLVEAIYGAVSRGTELLVFQGRVPPSEHARMRAPFQSGNFPYPVKYGYSSVGRVLEGPRELVGRAVFCLHPHQTRYVVPAAAVLPLPDDVPERRAVLAANLETALNGLWDAGVSAGDRVTVVGAGVVGLLTAYLAARHPGTDVEVVDVDPAKLAVARELGVAFRSVDDAAGDADVVVHASGSPQGLRTALALAGYEATVLELSWFGATEVDVPLGQAFHSRRLRLQSSQVGAMPARRRARWTNARRLGVALRLLADPRLDSLFTSASPFERLPNTMLELSAEKTAKSLCHRIEY